MIAPIVLALGGMLIVAFFSFLFGAQWAVRNLDKPMPRWLLWLVPVAAMQPEPDRVAEICTCRAAGEIHVHAKDLR